MTNQVIIDDDLGRGYQSDTIISGAPSNCISRVVNSTRGLVIETSDLKILRIKPDHLLFVAGADGQEQIEYASDVQLSHLLILENGNLAQVVKIAIETEDQNYFALDCPFGSNMIAFANGIKTYTTWQIVAGPSRKRSEACESPLHPYCPSTAFLDSLNVSAGLMSLAERACWELKSSKSQLAIDSALFEALSDARNVIFDMMLNYTQDRPVEFQQTQYLRRQNLEQTWKMFLKIDEHLSCVIGSNYCVNVRGCLNLARYRQAQIRLASSSMGTDLFVSASVAGLSLALFSLVMLCSVGVALLAWLYFESLLLSKVRRYVVMHAVVAVVICLRIVWWSFLLTGMGPQMAVSALAGRILFRVGMVLILWCTAYFFFLWLNVIFSTEFFRSRAVLRASTVGLIVVCVGGTVGVIVMGVLTEFGGSVEISLILLSSLDLILCAMSAVMTGLTLWRLTRQNRLKKQQRDGLFKLLVVEFVLICAFLIQLVVAVHVFRFPPLFDGAPWVQFFLGITVPDLLVFASLIAMNFINFKNASEKRNDPSSKTGLSSTTISTASITGGGFDADVQMESVPNRYRD